MREPVSESVTPMPARHAFSRVWRAVSPLLVLALLAGVGAWGYRSDWRFSGKPMDTTKSSDANEPRRVHAASAVGWCDAHGVHVCPLCRPDAAQLAKPPAVTDADRERVARALAVRPRTENRRDARWHEYQIEFPTAEAADRFGIDIAVVWPSAVTEAVTAPGELTYQPSRLSRPAARAPGTVARVFHKVGDAVKAGELLALIDSAETGKAKAEFLQAAAQLRFRTRALDNLKSATGILPQERREAEAALGDAEVRLLAAEQALAYHGLNVKADDYRNLPPEDAARKLRRIGLPPGVDATSANLLPVVAAIDGEVTVADAVAGEVVDPTKPLFTIADSRQMALTLHVPAADARTVAVGMPVRFRPDGLPDEAVGVVTFIALSADETTRAVAVRANLPNDRGRLRAFTLGVGRIILREDPAALVVPAPAVVAHDGCEIVFVRDRNYLKPNGPKAFHVRTVRVGARDGGTVEVIAGLAPGEVVAAKGTDLLLKELLKNDDR